MPYQIGGATAAYLAGLLCLDFGTYLEAFILSGSLLIFAAVMVLFIGAGRSGREPELAPAARLVTLAVAAGPRRGRNDELAADRKRRGRERRSQSFAGRPNCRSCPSRFARP